ncbi:hypothetical protein [Ralstonia thomasii]
MPTRREYPPDLFDLLVDALGRLNKSKKGVVLFLRGAGVDETDLAEVDRTVRASPDAINKFEIARNVLIKVNARGDSGLRPRREIIKRVVEFEDFSNCCASPHIAQLTGRPSLSCPCPLCCSRTRT